MNEMVERVAAVLKDHYERRHELSDLWGETALAAIAAMREPTEAMLDKARGKYATMDWQAMIRAALEGR